jgi:hypothetical protein
MLQISKEAIFYLKSVCLSASVPAAASIASCASRDVTRGFSPAGLQIEPAAGMLAAQFVQQARNVFACMFAGTEEQRQHDQMFDALRNQGLRGGRQIRGAGVQIGADAGQAGLHCLYQLMHGLYGLAPERVSGAMGQQDQTGPGWRSGCSSFMA